MSAGGRNSSVKAPGTLKTGEETKSNIARRSLWADLLLELPVIVMVLFAVGAGVCLSGQRLAVLRAGCLRGRAIPGASRIPVALRRSVLPACQMEGSPE
jgi:hypothetical protein